MFSALRALAARPALVREVPAARRASGAEERGRKASTLRDYRSVVRVHFLPAFGDQPLERITTKTIERWLSARMREGKLSRRSLQKMVVLLNGIFRRARKVWKLPCNPVAEVERVTLPTRAGIEFYSPEEVHVLVRSAGDMQDGALFLTEAQSIRVAIRTADPRELQEWMGHSDFSTTQIYMHYKPRADAARRLSAAFGGGSPAVEKHP